jgi:hypothetical protein
LHTHASSYTVPRFYALSLPSHHRSMYRPSASFPLALPSLAHAAVVHHELMAHDLHSV